MIGLPSNAPLTLLLGCVLSNLAPAPCRYDLVPVTTRPVAQTPAVLAFKGSLADSGHRRHSPLDRSLSSVPPLRRLLP